MARAHLKRKNKAGKLYNCSSCSDKIVAGQRYYEWSFRYGGTYRQHASHGSPKASQLTQSKMSNAYAAIEAAETDLENAITPSDVAEALQVCIDSLGEVRDEYQEALDTMISPDGSVGQMCQESIDNLERFISELEDAHSNADGADWDEELHGDALEEMEEPSEEDGDDAHTEWDTNQCKIADRDEQVREFEELKEAASSALSSYSF